MKKLFLVIVLSFVCISIASAQPAGGGGGRGRGGKGPGKTPPKEAIAACQSKSIGDACSFEGRRGESMEGSCIEVEDQTVCAPEDMPEHK